MTDTPRLGRPPEIDSPHKYGVFLSPAQVATAKRLGPTVSAGVRAALEMAEKKS